MGYAFVSTIELQTDVSVLFMVESIRGMRVYSALTTFLGKNGSNLAKMKTENLLKWIPLLQKENLHGWFSSIENKTAVEIALMNDDSVIKIVDCKPLQYNWTNSKYNNVFGSFSLVPKKWGTYEISTMSRPVKIRLNRRFQSQIEEYQKRVEEEDLRGTAFSVLLENAEISYFDAPLQKCVWD